MCMCASVFHIHKRRHTLHILRSTTCLSVLANVNTHTDTHHPIHTCAHLHICQIKRVNVLAAMAC